MTALSPAQETRPASPTTLSVRRVETGADFRAMLEFPWTLYRGDPNWVPPLMSMRRELLDRKKSASWEYLEGDYYVAWRRDENGGERPVGTIAAYINHRHDEYHDERVAWFGAFDVFDDSEAAAALLNTAITWAREHGRAIIRGPQTFSTHEETGLLADGFERPILLMPYNKPYYERLLLENGFAQVMETYSFYMGRKEVEEKKLDERLERVAKAVMKRGRITVRPFDIKRKAEDFRLLKDVYNAAWERNWGFVPMTERELDGLINSLGTFFDPRLVYFAYVEGEVAGMILGVPDFNQILQRAYPRPGVPEPITLLHLLYLWKVARVMDTGRVPLMGVKEQYRGKGVDVAMYAVLLRAMLDAGYQHSDSGWILSINESMVSIAKNFGSHIYRVYRYYERATHVSGESL